MNNKPESVEDNDELLKQLFSFDPDNFSERAASASVQVKTDREFLETLMEKVEQRKRRQFLVFLLPLLLIVLLTGFATLLVAPEIMLIMKTSFIEPLYPLFAQVAENSKLKLALIVLFALALPLMGERFKFN